MLFDLKTYSEIANPETVKTLSNRGYVLSEKILFSAPKIYKTFEEHILKALKDGYSIDKIYSYEYGSLAVNLLGILANPEVSQTVCLAGFKAFYYKESEQTYNDHFSVFTANALMQNNAFLEQMKGLERPLTQMQQAMIDIHRKIISMGMHKEQKVNQEFLNDGENYGIERTTPRTIHLFPCSSKIH